jgi:hypothetical protein
MSLLILALALLPVASAQTYITPCGGTFNLTKWVVTPANPAAGDTVVLNVTGVETGSTALTGGQGVINAYLFGADVFTAPFATCNQTTIDVLGLATGYLDAPHCGPTEPISQGQQGKINFSLAIPGEASGLGELTIILSASDSGNSLACAYCCSAPAAVQSPPQLLTRSPSTAPFVP